ncbi:MAG: nucleotidyltransferase family protein [Roseovarius sp.]|uniref:nucleotidyltransferase family protein n=1 Tax=Roseovarius sp. TaxID=1486281 RepID=UPI001B6A0708|nr:nucleotidyltransferase family protein [Roseovarius sp.]MBQ0752028.1 nucleotidyltransferase family protein [Roseovarius sp.]MBQ0812473.1 nucleotidyltransferase family protein [Roseovarius sp.]
MTDFASVILAGERDSRDALRDETGVACKALLDIGGTPMIRRVIDALRSAQSIGTIHLSGPTEACVQSDAGLAGLVARGEVDWVASGPSPSTSAHQMLRRFPATQPVLITTADHPLLTGEIVDHFCRGAAESGCDVVIGLAPYDLVRVTYPELKKTVLRFRDGGYCGCNLFAFLTEDGRRVADFWRQVEKDRKKPLVVIRLLGLWSLLSYRMGWLTLDRALARLSRRVGVRIGVVILPFAHASVDVDSVSDYVLVQQYSAEGRGGAEG